MICPHCGSVIPDNSVFCSQCGARITMPHAAEHASAASSNPATPAEKLANLVPEVVPAGAGADEEVEMPEVPLTGKTVVLPKSAVAAAVSEAPAEMPEVPLSGETVVIPQSHAEDAVSEEPAEMPEAPLAGDTVVMSEDAASIESTPAAEPAAEPEEMPEVPLSGETGVMPQDAADLAPEQAEEEPETEKTMAVPGRDVAEELQQVPAIEEPQDMPPAIPIEGTPVVMPEETKRAPEQNAYEGYQGLPAADEPGQTAVRRPVVVPLQTLSGGATPILQVPVNKHDTPDFRANVKHKRHSRPAPAPRTQQPSQFAQTVSRAEYEQRSANESYTEAEQEVFSERAQAPRASVSASSYVAPAAAYPEEGQGLEEHARRAETALRDEERQEPPVRRSATSSHTSLIAGICVAVIAVIALVIVLGTPNGSTTDTAATQQSESQDTSTQAEQTSSPVTTAGDVSYNSDTGELKIEKYGFSTTLPTGMTAEASSDGTGLELDDSDTGMHISAWAKTNDEGVTLDGAFEEAESVSGLTRSWISDLNGYFYVNWSEGKTSQYIREYINSDRVFALEFSWPSSKDEANSAIIDSMTDAISMEGQA